MILLHQLVFAKFPINKRGIFVLKRAYNSGQITSLGYYILSNQSKSIELWKCYSTTSNINSCVNLVEHFFARFSTRYADKVLKMWVSWSLSLGTRYTCDMTSALRGRKGVSQILNKGREVAWIWYWQGGGRIGKLEDVICTWPLR